MNSFRNIRTILPTNGSDNEIMCLSDPPLSLVEIITMFQPYGTICEAELIIDSEKRPTGLSRLKFINSDERQKAISTYEERKHRNDQISEPNQEDPNKQSTSKNPRLLPLPDQNLLRDWVDKIPGVGISGPCIAPSDQSRVPHTNNHSQSFRLKYGREAVTTESTHTRTLALDHTMQPPKGPTNQVNPRCNTDEEGRRLFVFIPDNKREEEVFSDFNEYGLLEYLHIVAGQKHRYAFVCYFDTLAALRAYHRVDVIYGPRLVEPQHLTRYGGPLKKLCSKCSRMVNGRLLGQHDRICGRSQHRQ